MRVLVCGAGIAGLALALRLHQRGLSPLVVERAPRLRDGGYMLGLSDPGLDAAERMGVAEALWAARHVPERLVYLDGQGREKFAIGAAALDRLVGERQFNLMRGDIERTLRDRLADRVPIRFGTSVAGLETDGEGVRARLEDGTEVAADLLVGADGLHSRVRALRFGPERDFLRPLGARVAAFLLDRSAFPGPARGTSCSLTEPGRAVALADAGEHLLVAFFIWRTGGQPRRGTAEAELRAAFAGAGWLVPALLDRLPGGEDLYFDEVAQVVMPRWAEGRSVLLGDAACAVSLVAGKGATLALAGACLLADALADAPDAVGTACARYERRLRPLAERAQRMARRNVSLFTPGSRLQLLAREALLRLAARPALAPLMRRLLDRGEERLYG